MQHFFNTHIFKSSIESCREEGIQCELEPDYVDNVPCIDLISSLVQTSLSILSSTGFFFKSILFSQIADGPVEYAGRGVQGPRHSHVQKVRLQHNSRLFESKSASSDLRVFGIQHFAGRVVYDASDCLGIRTKWMR